MSIYIPRHFAVDDRAAALQLVREYPFATLVTPSSSEPMVSHVPLLLSSNEPDCDTLIGHFARANPHWKHASGIASVAIFHGPHAYVSPSFYAEPAAAVPTWNYAIV